MPQRNVTIASSVGLHARPAGIFTKAATASGAQVTIGRPGDAGVNAASLLMVMGLGLKHGETAELVVEGADADTVLNQLAGLLATDLDAAGE
ncbi:HPr family phosphocarrier protein [Cellulomonas denverensis]|uniref:HPr family phosphocarrier protein n=1 Tax=Cellulomonas denverensis TaxID=264297 RepID=A0A7X6KWR7_9CELL|nr:HPr family phosphocarrier protein [Cellulomonas denverensis]NKY23285.1 HPr family phosphocarrier protein [Cellulomonas denverensis]GIG26403.1 phosphotransferase [Cellulomonas denverensis]